MRLPLSLLVRRTHLFTALFLTPWVVMYAVSTIVMHHTVGEASEWTLVEERSYPVSGLDHDRPHVAATEILGHLGLEGAFATSGSLSAGELTIYRGRAFGTYRITALPGSDSIRVERERPGMASILENLHRRRGYEQAVVPNLLWALSVDLVIVAILFWAASGVWMWWEMERTRKLGALLAGLSSAAFMVFLLTL